MKKFIIIAAIVIVFGGAGYFEYLSRQNLSGPDSQPAATSTGGITVKESLLNRINNGGQSDCLVTPSPGNDIIVLAKDDLVRIDSSPDMYGQTPNNRDWITVQNGGWVYAWNGNIGVKISADALDSAIEAGNTEAEKFSWRSLAKKWQEENAVIQCQDAKLSELLFAIPEEVNFVDLTGQLSNLDQALQNVIANAGGPAATGSSASSTNSGGVQTEYESLGNGE